MNYYENVVMDYLRADRTLFINTECCIQLNEGDNPDTSGLHWYCDAVAIDFRASTVFLCEVSYSLTLADLFKRLKGWFANWDAIRVALVRDSKVPQGWPIRPWLFVPEQRVGLLVRRLKQLSDEVEQVAVPVITTLEMVQPWNYRSWNRVGEAAKPDIVPVPMR